MSPKYRRVLVIPFTFLLALMALLLFACGPKQPTPTPVPPTSTPTPSTPTLGSCNELNRETLYPLTPIPAPTPTPTTIPDGELGLFWEIRAEVNCGQVQVYKDISIWQLGSAPKRLWRGVVPFVVNRVPSQDFNPTQLSEGVCLIVDDTSKFDIEGGVMVFNGGYIMCQDWELRTQVLDYTGYQIDQVVFEDVFKGKDVNIQTEISLTLGVNAHSIMFYPQSDLTGTHPLSSSLGITNGVELRIDGTITNTDPITFEIDGKEVVYTPTYSLDGWHELQVRENGYDPADFPTDTFKFELLIDDNIVIKPIVNPANPLGNEHDFTLGFSAPHKIIFYIGYHPDFPNQVFRGRMSYWIFDPNDSCPGCG